MGCVVSTVNEPKAHRRTSPHHNESFVVTMVDAAAADETAASTSTAATTTTTKSSIRYSSLSAVHQEEDRPGITATSTSESEVLDEEASSKASASTTNRRRRQGLAEVQRRPHSTSTIMRVQRRRQQRPTHGLFFFILSSIRDIVCCIYCGLSSVGLWSAYGNNSSSTKNIAGLRRRRQRNGLLVTALIIVSLSGIHYLSDRVQSNRLRAAIQQQHERADAVGRVLYLTDRHSSAEWQPSPVLAEDDVQMNDPRDETDDYYDDDDANYGVVHPGVVDAGPDTVDKIMSFGAAGGAKSFGAAGGGDKVKEKSIPEDSGELLRDAPIIAAGDGAVDVSASETLLSTEAAVLQRLANLTLDDPYQKYRQLHQIFEATVRGVGTANDTADASRQQRHQVLEPVLQTWLHHWNQDILNNVASGVQWSRSYVGRFRNTTSSSVEAPVPALDGLRWQYPEYYAVTRRNHHMKWRDEWDAIQGSEHQRGPLVDYTDTTKYEYLPTFDRDEKALVQSLPFKPLGELLSRWPQNEDRLGPIREVLRRWDYTNATSRDMAVRYRDASVPFKVVNVPDVAIARLRWTDEYLSTQFDHAPKGGLRGHPSTTPPPSMDAVVHESINNIFEPYDPDLWDIFEWGLAPTRQVRDSTFKEWSQHALYADAVRLGANYPHFVFHIRPPTSTDPTADAPMNGTFVTRELYMLTDTKDEWFSGDPSTAHCEFGERGTVMAMQVQAENSFVAVITGAVRILLSPPSAYAALGIGSTSDTPSYRRSSFDLSHLSLLQSSDPTGHDMPMEERSWLNAAATVDAIETVVTAGEVLFIPRHWSQYSVSLQKSARCTVQSGI